MISLKNILLSIFIMYLTINQVRGQDDNKYILGEEEKLQIIVYIIGEIKNPDEYKVPDKTNVVELITKAGGATQFSDLSAITITRNEILPMTGDIPLNSNTQNQKSIIRFDVNKYLTEIDSDLPPILQPGDVIFVPKNKWHTWRGIATVARDLAVVASAYFLYLRVAND